MTDKIVVLSTCGSAEEAAQIARALVEKKLAACVNVTPAVRSFYRWKGAIEDDQESLFESGLLDSFALPDLVSAIEKEFAMKVPDSDLHPRKFDSVARMDDYLADHAS